ncbi:MAG: sulfite exporter TauE/SafE family protein [Deltaproteobacteria bacterium]|nr:sulfite exporter TauE/SafE family protein [Deltaproteobacteria bacterium]
MTIPIVLIVIFLIAVLMTMAGRGGGNFYVVALVITGQTIYQAATMGQFILMVTACAGMLIFHKNKLVDWKLALVIDPPTDIMAFAGGYFSSYVSGVSLKFMLAGLLALAGITMLLKVKDKPILNERRFGFWHRKFGDQEYIVNLWLTIPITATVGLVAGALGISGGSFKVPLMVLLCGVPMRIAVGTSSAMVAATALMGFAGHAANGHFDAKWALPITCVAVLGGIIGGKFAMKTKPRKLKMVFAYTTFAAAILMVINTIYSNMQ